MDEGQIVELLVQSLEESGHLTFQELVLTDTLLDIQQLSDTESRKRIDLAALNKYDGQILFFEAERELTVKHPLTFQNFADFTYLAAPESAYESLPKKVQQEQINWAKETGLGIVLIKTNGSLSVLTSSRRNRTYSAEIRAAIRSLMRNQDPLSGMYPVTPPFAR